MATTATGETLIQDALFACGAFGVGDDLSNEDAQLCLRRLNRMLDSWANERNMIYGITEESFAMTAGTATYSTSLLTNGRPVEVLSIVVMLNNIWWEVKLIDNVTFNDIPYKITQSVPNRCYYDQAFPNANFNFYPIPYADFTCKVSMQRVLTGPILLNTTVALPEGYEAAIVDNLGVDIAPSFGRPVSSEMLRRAQQERRVLKRTNFMPGVMETQFAQEGDPDPSNGFIYRGF